MIKNYLRLLTGLVILNSSISTVQFITHLVEHNSKHYTYHWALFSSIIAALYAIVLFVRWGIIELKSSVKIYEIVQLDQYRDPWLAKRMDEFIGFYPREYYCLDNFSSFKVNYNGILYDTVEHAYQALKFKDSSPEIYDVIKNCYSAHEAQRLAYENNDKCRSDWDDIKLEVMEKLLRLKLAQNPYVKKKLLETKHYSIVEDSPKDSFWGIGFDRNGNNELGKLWMKLRDELISSSQTN